MHRWENCPGSVRQNAGIPDSPASVYAAAGTAAHELAARLLSGDSSPTSVDPETLEAVMVYVDTVRSDCGRLWIEQPVSASHVHPGLRGTADAVTWSEKDKLLRVYDYKHGAGVLVEAEDNSQLLYYAVGAVQTLSLAPTDIELVIVQPRLAHPDGSVRRWRFEAGELKKFEERLRIAAERTEDPNAPLAAGPWCRWCKSSGVCKELGSASRALAAREFSPVTHYDPQLLADTLEKLPTVEAWISGVRAFALAEAERGRCPPGFSLVASRASRSWSSDAEARSALRRAGLSDRDIHEPLKLLSPAKMEKKLPRENLLLIELLSDRVSKGHRLVRNEGNSPLAAAVTEFTAIDRQE